MLGDPETGSGLTKTQQWIIDALLERMRQTRYSKITVKEIAKSAQVARATFYLNFQSKDDVLNRYIESLYTEFREKLAAGQPTDAYELACVYFEFWHSHLEFVRTLQAQDLFHLLLERHEYWIRDIFGTIGENKPLTRFTDTRDRDFFAVYQSGGLWHLLKRWVESGARENPEYLGRVFARITAGPGETAPRLLERCIREDADQSAYTQDNTGGA